MTEITERKLNVIVRYHDESDHDINDPDPHRPRRDPTQPSNQEEVGEAKCHLQRAQRH